MIACAAIAVLVLALPAAPAAARASQARVHPTSFEVLPDAIFGGQLPLLLPDLGIAIAGDPSVLKDGNGYRMYYACFGFNVFGTEVCRADSEDGIHWVDAEIGSQATFDRGQVLFGRPGTAWDGAHETPFAVKHGRETRLYMVGYASASDGFFGSPSVPMGLARSTDGLHFSVADEPILVPTAGGLDDHGMTSPSVFRWNDGWGMTYTGWCFESTDTCPRLADGRYVALLGATSPDGVHWTKQGGNLLPDDQLPAFAPNGIAETHVFKGPDDVWVLLFAALTADAPHTIGIATGPTPFGPWEVRPQPLIKPSDLNAPFGQAGVVAPHGMIEGNTLKVWFAGEGNIFRIGYGEGPWPLPPVE